MSIFVIKLILTTLAIGLTSFYLAKKAFAEHIPENDFKYWLYSWGIITALSFSAGNFWLFIGASAVVTYYFGKRIDNRVAYFLILLFVFPPYAVITPIIYVTHFRILALVIMLPMLLNKKWRKNTPSLGKPLGDKLIIGLLLLMLILNMRGTTPGDSVRTSVTFFIDWFLPYFVISRCIKDFEALKVATIALLTACTIAAVAGFIEHMAFWPLYSFIPGLLKMNIHTGFLLRGGELRASSAMGHALTFGFVLVPAIGICLPLLSIIKSKKLATGIIGSLLAGLYGSISRGPWGAAMIVSTIYFISGKNLIKRSILIALAFVIAINVLPSIPGGQKFVNMMPFVGESEQFNVKYRQVLIDKAILILKRKPLFGVFDAREEPEMADMVQGEGIVDIVNTYLNIGLSYGLVGLSLFLWLIFWLIYNIIKVMKYIKDKDSFRYKLGLSQLAIYCGLLVMFTSAGITGVAGAYLFVLFGLSASYIRIIKQEFRERIQEQTKQRIT